MLTSGKPISLNNPFKIIAEREAKEQFPRDMEKQNAVPCTEKENKSRWTYGLYTGATVEEAIQKGLNDLDIPRMKAHITVVAWKKGFWLVW